MVRVINQSFEKPSKSSQLNCFYMTDLQSFEVRVADLLGVCELLSESSTEIREDMAVCQQGKRVVDGGKREIGERKKVEIDEEKGKKGMRGSGEWVKKNGAKKMEEKMEEEEEEEENVEEEEEDVIVGMNKPEREEEEQEEDEGKGSLRFVFIE